VGFDADEYVNGAMTILVVAPKWSASLDADEYVGGSMTQQTENGADLSSLPLGRVVCGDNCEVMRHWPSQSIDLVVTSPPYDELRTYGGHSWDFFGVAWNINRLLKPGGVLVWVVADATKDGSETGTSMDQALHFKRIGMNLHDTMIWNKGTFAQAGDLSVRYGQAWEYCFVLSNGKPRTFNRLDDRKNVHAGKPKHGTIRNPNGTVKRMSNEGVARGDFGARLNVWEMSAVMSNTERTHPAQFPSTLARDHITTWSNPGDIILDPFAGSGTTLKAAQDLGRLWVGIEINPDYISICEARTAQASLDLVSV
jgi:site-specific DNA-methyltransferase (adenine-specific)